MKKFLIIIFVCTSFAGIGQTFNNSWINYSQSYYKFRIGKDGVYRIPFTTLQAAGLGSVPAEQFQLWRNGEEQRIYTSKPSGALSAGDYIEFFGLKNDGKPDNKLYRDPDFQLTDKNSLITDTASYFLTVKEGVNARFADAANNVSGNALPAEQYYMNTVGTYMQSQINPGYSIPVGGVYLYSSSYDQAEGWSSKYIPPSSEENGGWGNLNIYFGGPDATVRYTAAGCTFNSRNVQLTLKNGTFTGIVSSDPMPNFSYLKKEFTLSTALLSANPNWVQFAFKNTSSVATDRMVISSIEFTYPSKFNFNNLPVYYFELPPTAQGNYLEITNFNTGGVAPALYDYTTGKRYVGDISTPGKVKFALPPSVNRQKFRLVSQDVNNSTAITALVKRDFIDYSKASNEGNYIIISNPVLYNSGTGTNYVEEYRQYRGSVAGGNYKAIVVDINEITDQFAFGIDKHPLSIKDFIQFANAKFSPKPEFVFIIGKGVAYNEYRKNISSIYSNQLNLVPSFGSPASDILLSSPYGITTPTVPIGRLSAINSEEVEAYFSKVKQYEAEQQSTVQTIEAKSWMKNVMQIVGGKDSSENAGFRNYMYGYRSILEDTLVGAHVELFSKTSNSAVQLIATKRIAELFKEGTGLVSYFGHSSANTLEYNLSDPASYDNQNKYPVFLVSGCTAGNTFVFDSTRIFENNKSISENFVLSPQRGAIAFLASTHYGIPPYLDDYNRMLYGLASEPGYYGKPLGLLMQQTIKKLDGDDPGLYFFSRADLEEMGLQGDPAIRMFIYPKPDYDVELSQIQVNPSFISVSEEKFNLKVAVYNLGKAISDSIYLQIKRIYPAGNAEIIYRSRIAGIRFADSLSLNIPIIPTRDKGLNKLVITIDDENTVDELSESNNTATKEFYIFEDEAKPIYPQNYSIIGNATQKLYASTANPNADSKEYRFEIDTTMLFNSPLKVSSNLTSAGGIIEFNSGLTYTDSTVYYWRISLVPASGEASDYKWLNSSFQYINGQSGYSQSHYYQHLNSDTVKINLDTTRRWKFAEVQNYIFANTGVYPTAATLGSEMQANLNGTEFAAGLCPGALDYTIYFNVVDPVTLTPWYNTMSGRFGSAPICDKRRLGNFYFNNITTPARRKQVMDFLDSIPDNYIVIARWIGLDNPAKYVYAAQWASDTAIFGSGNSLYHKLRAQGFAEIDSFNAPRTFIFMYEKNNPDFRPEYIFSKGIYDKIELKKYFLSNDSIGYITSPRFGPSKKWNYLHWKGQDLSGNPGNDNAKIMLYGSGYNVNADPTLLLTIDKSQTDVDISGIDSKQFPYLQLKMRNVDSTTFTPYQLNYWMLDADQIPEGAVAPKIYYVKRDTLEQGELFNFGIAFKNISMAAFDSLKINMVVIDSRNVTHTVELPRGKPLVSGDTLRVNYQFDTKDYPGLNTLFIEFNPDNDQPEVLHSNNFLYHNFYVKPDNFNPMLDVTFDGVHILNRDIVSSKPHITIKLKDESRFLKLSDTSLLVVKLRYPDGKLRTIPFDNDTLRFTPGNGANGNAAVIDFTPSFYADDEEYELVVTGKDVVGNTSPLDYHVTFRVIGKPMISNFLNYPNPFTTSTAFVFTITGSEVPQNIRIQILTVTGKVVREITQQELGPLHIGRNITEFKWDGTDMYGQSLANGVYLYRVLTNLNGKSMDKFTDNNDNTDKYFNQGYGKMYLMR